MAIGRTKRAEEERGSLVFKSRTELRLKNKNKNFKWTARKVVSKEVG